MSKDMSKDAQATLPSTPTNRWRGVLHVLELYVVAFVGGYIAHWIGFPAAWLTGSLLSVAIWLFAGRKLFLPPLFRDVGMAMVGMILGTGFSPETFHAIASWPLSIVLLFFTVVLVSGGAYAVLRRIGRWDHATALFSSLPGALSYVVVIAEAAGADMTRVAVAQTIRVFALISILPILITSFSDGRALDASAARAVETASQSSLDVGSILLMVLPLCVLVLVVLRLKIPAGMLLSGMFVAGCFYLSGIYHEPLPQWIAIPGFLTVGIMIGSRFGAVTFRDLLRLSWISLLSLFVSVLIAVLASLLGAELLGFPLAQVFLAYAPGGFETMVLLAFLFDLDPAFVAGHHLVRYVGLVILAPIITARLTRGRLRKP